MAYLVAESYRKFEYISNKSNIFCRLQDDKYNNANISFIIYSWKSVFID